MALLSLTLKRDNPLYYEETIGLIDDAAQQVEELLTINQKFLKQMDENRILTDDGKTPIHHFVYNRLCILSQNDDIILSNAQKNLLKTLNKLNV